ncbi:MAG: hypothetical protein ACLFVJ_20540 [Persicimonas sp.]
MSDENELYIRLGGDAVAFMKDWMERREQIHQKRMEFADEVGADALYLENGNQYLRGWVGEADKPHLTIKKRTRFKGERRDIVRPDKRYKEGKRLSARMSELAMPDHCEVLDYAGIPHHYIKGRRMRVPGIDHVGFDHFVTGVHADQFDESEISEGCEVLKKWEFLKIKDEVEQ